jgi:uncharacterized protein YndB with AHSA1/START domain
MPSTLASKAPRKKSSGKKQAKPEDETKPKIKIMWTYRASIEEIWDLWTTRAGLETWWAPEEFVMRVRRNELRPGGEFEYAVTAMDLPQVEALNAAGLPLSRIDKHTYTEVVPYKRIGYRTTIDYVPDVAPYEVATLVEFSPVDKAVRIVVTQDAMHNSEWTQTLALDLDKQFNRLARVVEKRREEEEKSP